MKLYGLTAPDVTALSDSALDSAYAQAWVLGDSRAYTAAAVEILTRKGTPLGFLDSLMTNLGGGSAFPKYDQIQTNNVGGAITAPFISSDVAGQAVVDSVGKVANALDIGAKLTLLVVGAVAVAVIASKVRK